MRMRDLGFEEIDALGARGLTVRRDRTSQVRILSGASEIWLDLRNAYRSRSARSRAVAERPAQA